MSLAVHRLSRRLGIVCALVAAALVLWPAAPEGALARRTSWLEVAVRQARASDRLAVWVYFTDKGAETSAGTVSVSARAESRRVRRGTPSATRAYDDRALAPAYVAGVGAVVSRVRHTSRWLNAMSVEATAAQIDALAGLPFVARLDVVRRARRVNEPVVSLPVERSGVGAREAAEDAPLDYGPSLDQLRQIRVPELHARGLHGEGVVVAVFDSGFPNLAHEAFSAMTIAAERDFVRGLDTVRESTDAHGTNTLSTLGGFAPSRLVGPAYAATFLLAVTEDVASETPIEEDHWAAAAEWAEGLGADVISSSLGYAAFDQPYTSYTDRDMDGQTAVTTRAAALAAERGVVVVNSAGNEGFDAARNTLVAPADGVHVLTAGAVTRAGTRAAFSSVGPTADGRTKPDVVAMGVNVVVARQFEHVYGVASGTSFSCPLTSGVVALVLQAHPDYTVNQVLDAVRGTAGQSGAPDRLLGWGLLDAVAAVDAVLIEPGAPR
jgi:serine protease AprX